MSPGSAGTARDGFRVPEKTGRHRATPCVPAQRSRIVPGGTRSAEPALEALSGRSVAIAATPEQTVTPAIPTASEEQG